MDSTAPTPLRPRLQRLLALAACVLGPAWFGCAQPVSQPCSPTLICPPGYACTNDNLDCFKCADPLDCTTETGVGCGNNKIDLGEACDDGNLRSGDGCNAECTSDESCGNGFRDLVVDGGSPEVCDDGNTSDGDGCSRDCGSNEVCGNGIKDFGEQCDDKGVSTDDCRTDCVKKGCGNGSDAPAHIEEFYWSDGGIRERCDDGNDAGGDGCSADCLVLESCGNGVVDFGFEADGGAREECDDRNLVDGDGCSSFCKNEVCGNGVLDRVLVDGGFEVCDDGNAADGDGCSADCRSNETCGNGTTDRVLKDGGSEQCDDGNRDAGDGCGPICWWEQCGNGYLDSVYSDGGFRSREQCDDGNLDAGDGCGPMCWREECGNGFVDLVFSDGGYNWDGGLPVEQCDDGNRDGGDGCGPACWREECGNGYLDSIRSVGGYQGYEQCDDGNTQDGDFCSALCWIPTCGNGYLDTANARGANPDGGLLGREQCDDGNTRPGDGCSAFCQFEGCGNGLVDTLPDGGMEDCDDGNRDPGDKCGPDCRWEECGNGVLDSLYSDGGFGGFEQCDDGNSVPGDGCGASCWREECGNGIPDLVFSDGGFRGYEQCDDGNKLPGDNCGPTCWREECGNGILDDVKSTGANKDKEQCDDGNLVTGDGCGATCWREECGNGIVDAIWSDGGYNRDGGQPFEQCDDGDTLAGDGCGASCWREECGNTIVDVSYSDGGFRNVEQCDDGDTLAGDRCGSSCWFEQCGNGIVDAVYSDGGFRGVEQCDDENKTAGDGCGPMCWREECGNGFLDPVKSDGGFRGYEQCDDENATVGDGCGLSCWREECGNGIVDVTWSDGGYNRDGGQPFEQCDDDNRDAGDGCGATCWREECGNTIVDLVFSDGGYNRVDGGRPLEQCDDGNRVPGDGCGATCWREECGNTIVDLVYSDGGFRGVEQCDDGNLDAGDRCGASCWREECGNAIVDLLWSDGGNLGREQCDDENRTPGDGCGVSCWFEECGNGLVDVAWSDGGFRSTEQCDDNNRDAGDGCGASCWREECGNAIVDAIWSDGGFRGYEQCDDENRAAGDGCGPMCWLEECGNGYHDTYLVNIDGGWFPAEECDDGNKTTGDGCGTRIDLARGLVTSCLVEVCGNGIRELAEQCDDGPHWDNRKVGATVGGDGCSAVCEFEACGNGRIDTTLVDGGYEQCDDFGQSPGDGCGPTCWYEECGNGVVDGLFSDGGYNRDGGAPFEQCDDQNHDAGDGCGASCWREECGNTLLDSLYSSTGFNPDGGTPFEQCDDGNRSPGDGCGPNCWSEVCGNGYVDSVRSTGGFSNDGGLLHEQCDDWNIVGGDGCSAVCWREECGNKYLDVDLFPDGGVREQCDDGNLASGDGCSANCRLEACGNGVVDLVLADGGFEQCDDGNTTKGDGCGNICWLEQCGNGVLDNIYSDGGYNRDGGVPFEQCDDGNRTPGDGCGASCWTEQCGNTLLDSVYSLGGQVADGGTTPFEQCDDGNTVAGDGCSAKCWVEACGNGITDNVVLLDGGREDCDLGALPNTASCNRSDAVNASTGQPVGCRLPTCGDGFHNPLALTGRDKSFNLILEQCDDGNTNNNDGCLNRCELATCGDGVVQAGEEDCDDGNTIETDSCRNNCSWNRCGDGSRLTNVNDALSPVQVAEECDDNNTTPADGCSVICRVELCGNSYLDSNLLDGGFEACDDGNTTGGDLCSANCRSQEVCGNGIVDDAAPFDFPPGTFDGGAGVATSDGGWRRNKENCDDGDFLVGSTPQGGDGCSAICQREECGNGFLDIDTLLSGGFREQCDDGNTVATPSGSRAFYEPTLDRFYTSSTGVRAIYDLPTNTYYTVLADGGTEPVDPATLTTIPPGCGPSCRFEICGNGILDPGEQCDDGNTIQGDGCDNNCNGTACGNGQLDPGQDPNNPTEECDPGPLGDSPTCNGINAGGRKCKYQLCGDAYTNEAISPATQSRVEQCDPGQVGVNSTTCTSICKLSFCGDQFVNPVANEQCDPGQKPDGGGLDLFYCNGADGGTVLYGDGGTAACKVARCGDGYVNAEAGEGCDALLNGSGVPLPLPSNGCSATCQNAACGDGITDTAFGEVCDLGTGSDTSICNRASATSAATGGNVGCRTPVCGDGYRNTATTEQCDDGNASNLDSCTNTCANSACGDGFVNLFAGGGLETCDDGNTTNESVCPYGETACIRCNATCTGTLTEATLGLNVCGDGVQDLNKVKLDGTTFSEACDDGNTDTCGACNSSCTGTNTLTASTGQIKVTYSSVTGNTVYDGVVMTIRDGIAAAPYVFEFDTNSSVTAGRTPITLAGGDTSAKKIGDKIVAAINGTAVAITAATATNASPSFITLTHDTAGIQGNQLIQLSGTTPPTDFSVTGMASGTGRDCPSNTGCFSNNDCRYGSTCQIVSGSKICAGPPAPPENVLGTVSTPGDDLNGQVRVAWSAVPANQSGGAVVTSYSASATDGTNTFSCSTSATPPATPALNCVISGLANGTTYTLTVTATNVYGTSVDSISTTAIPRTVPGAPTISSAPSGSDQAVTVTWTAPSNGGNAITSYKATAKDASNNTFFCDTTATPPATPALSCTISGLTNGTPYTVTVTATNAAGTGNSSSPLTPTPFGPPSAPLNVSVTSGTSAQLAVTWQAPTDNGGATITRYDAYAKQGGVQRGTCFTTSTAPSTPTLNCNITGLTNGQSYDVTVVATNVQSKVGATSAAVTKVVATKPGAPTLNTVGNGTSLTLSPSWTASANTGGPALLSFTAYAKQGGVEKGSCTTPDGTTLTCNITPLVDGESYDVTVIATNAEGYASDPSNSVAKIPASGPTAPTLTSVTNGTSLKLTANWNAPSSTGGSSISSYTAYAKQGGVQKGSCTTPNGTTLTCDIGGLLDGETYAVTVTATSAAGLTSVESNSLSKMTGTQPGAPSLTTVTNGTSQRLVPTWTAPANTGGSSVSFYTAYAKQGSTTIQLCNTPNGSTLTCNIDNLADGQTYTVTVTATNQAGIEGVVSNSINKIPGTAPTAPAITSVASGTSGRLTPTWTAPSSAGGSSLSYTAYARQVGTTVGSCTTSSLSCNIDSLTDGESYTVTVMATNAAGLDGPESVAVTKVPGTTPNAPTNVSAPSGANGQVVLTWAAPTNTGGASITSYDAVVKDGSSNTAGTCSVNGSTFTCTIGSLNNGTEYTVTLTATNAAGLTSAATAAATFTPFKVPDAPSITSTVHGDTEVAVDWDAPASDGGATITGYTVTATATGQTTRTCTTTSVAPATPNKFCTVTNLVNGVTYTFKVSATNAAGTGADSAGVTATPSRLPDVPSISAATPGNGQVQLAWAVTDNGGATITDYVIERSSDNGANWTVVNDGTSAATSYAVTDLTNGQEYAFRVSATNLNGTTTPSDPAVATPRTVPTAPQNVVATSGQDKKTDVSWSAPTSDGSAAITAYTVTATAAGQQTRTCTTTSVAPATPATSCSVLNLVNAVTYEVRVVATNVAGDSPQSPAGVTAKPDKVPPAPGTPSALARRAPGNFYATVSWTAPAGSDFSPVDYYELEASLAASGTASPPARSGAAMATVGLSALLFGGHDGTSTLGDTWEYNKNTLTWTQLAADPNAPTARSGAAMAGVGSEAYLFGGAEGSSLKGDLYKWSATGWSQVTANPDPVHGLPVARSDHAMVEFNNNLVLFGGTDGTNDLDDTWTYDTTANAWTKRTPGTVPPARRLHALATYTHASVTKTLLFGGLVGGAADNGMYEWDGTDWTLIPVASRPDARSAHSMVSTGGGVLLFGGLLGTGLRTGSTHQWDGAFWSIPAGSTTLPARSLAAAAAPGNVPVVFGGTTDTGERLRDTYDNNGGWRQVASSQKVLVAAGTSADVNNLAAGNSYVFRVRAHNDMGVGAYSGLSESLKVGTPLPPTVLTCQGNQDGKVPLTWDDATQDPGNSITHYLIQFSSDNGATWTDYSPEILAPVSPMVGATYTVDDAPSTQLTNGTTYLFRMAGRNGAGLGPFKQAASSCTPDINPAAPSAPTVVDLENDKKIRVTWSAPSPSCSDASTACSAITSYRVSYRPAGGGAVIGTFTGTTPLDVTVANNGVSYEFFVEAANGVGVTNWSDPSAASSAVAATYSPSKPGTPTGTPGNQVVTLNWNAPNTNNGSAITGYTVEQSSDDGATWAAATTTGIADPLSTTLTTDVTGLANGTAYRFRVTAVNPVNAATPSKGQPSDQSSAYTPRTFPGTPGQLTGTPGNQQVVLTWDAPASNGGEAITDYLVQYSSDSGSTWATAKVSGSTVTRTALANPAAASLSATLSGLANGTPYVFRVTGVNPANDNALLVAEQAVNPGVNGNPSTASAAVTPRTVPQAPTPVTTKVRGDTGTTLAPVSGEVELSWSAPDSGGAPITDYIIQYRVDGAANWTTFTDAVSTATAVKVTGLVNGTLYDFRVAAVNVAGTGGYTDPAVTATPRTVPSAPTGLTAAVMGEAGSTAVGGEVQLTWQAPSDNGGSEITTYILEYSTDNFASYTPVSTGGVPVGLTYKLTGLTNGTSYSFRVFARNAANPTGLGAGNLRSTSVTATPRRTPDAPLSLSASAGSSSAQLSWSIAAPFNNGGSALTDFTIVFKKNGGAEQVYADGVSTQNTATVTGLEPGASYEFKVAAVNGAGTGSYTAFASPVIPYTVPTKPLAVVVTNGVGGELTVSWTAPASDGFNAITQYTATASPGNKTCTSAGTSCVISGLSNGTDQAVTVVATNAAGDGAASDSVTKRVGTVPGAPTLNSVGNGTSQTLTANWTAGTAGSGGATTGYTATFVPTSGTTLTCTSAGTSCSVTNAVNGTQYTVSVKATNAVGDGPDSGSLSKFAGTFPAAPTLNSVANGTSQTLTANWTGGSGGNGGGTITYTATFVPTSGTTITCTSTGTSCSVNNAVNGTSYSVTVAAANNAGTGNASSPAQSKVAGTYPNAPTALTLTAGPASPHTGPGSGKLAASWTAPSAPGLGFTAANLTYTAIVTNTSSGATVTTTGCSGVSTTSCTISGLTDGTNYTVKIQATNAAGTDNVTSVSSGVTETPFTFPGAPTNVFVSDITSATAQVVTWTAPTSDGGKAVTNYFVQRSNATGSGFAASCNTTTNSCTATVPATLATANYYRVCASNVAGNQNACSAWSTVTVNYPSGSPGAPRNVAITGVTSTAITVSYTAPAYSASTVTRYYVERATNPTFTSGASTVNANSLSQTHSSLVAGTLYYFRVYAQNTQGFGAYSATVSMKAGAPTGPSNVQAAGVAGNTVEGQLGVSWTASASTNGGGTITYTVRAYTGTAPNLVEQGTFCQTTTTSCNLTGLVDGTAYTVKVVPSNTRGDGIEGSATLKPWSVPSATVLNLTAVRPSNDNAYIFFDLPATGTGGFDAAQFIVQFSEDAAAYVQLSTQPTVTYSTVNGLTRVTTNNLSDTSNKTYQYKVILKNAAGTGPTSAASGCDQAQTWCNGDGSVNL